MNYLKLTRKLQKLDCEFDRQAKGSHEVWICLRTGTRTTIPNWGSKDLKPGTISGILKDLGISKEDFENA
ncbi:MAG: type II toxin-antitoxin system HicA family toxin [Chloroflexota bacterium]|nr:type II toxin-antitoxin system HicA family toxin [Chloroflexota bacterium]